MYEGDEINSFDGNGTFDRPGAIMSSSPDEQQNAEPVKAPKAPKADSTKDFAAAKSLASNPNTPQFFGEAAMAANPYPTQRSRSSRVNFRKPLIIGGAVVGVIAIIAIIILAISGGIGGGEPTVANSKVAGEMNVGAIFDANAPIPYRTSAIAPYGYITQDGTKWVTPKQYSYAEQFYGKYAKAKLDGKTVIIDREGNTVIEKPDTVDVHYEITDNVWIVGDDVYNVELEKANPDKSTASYAGYGFAFVVPEVAGAEKGLVTGATYIVKVETGEKLYTCETAGCSIVITKGMKDDNFYLIVLAQGKGAQIVLLNGSKKLYESDTNKFLVQYANGIYAEYSEATNKPTKYLILDDGKVKTAGTPPSYSEKTSISNSDKYYVEACTGGKGYKVTNKPGDTVLDCSTNKRIFLPTIVYKRFEKEGKEVIIQYSEGGYHLFDLNEKKNIKDFKDVLGIEFFDNSPFVRITTKENKQKICNLLGSEEDCIDFEGKKVEAYATYIIIDGKTYSFNLKEVKYVGEK